MSSASVTFTIKDHGLETPCRLVYCYEAKEKEIVQFPKGLRGVAIFSEPYASDYKPAFMRFGIEIPDDKDASDLLKSKKVVTLEDEGFGEAFFRYAFPKMRKAHPERFVWQVLFPKLS